MNLVLSVISYLIEFYSIALIVYILMSWFPNARGTLIGQFLAKICEPYLEQFRKFIPPLGMIDISPIVALLSLKSCEIRGFSTFSLVYLMMNLTEIFVVELSCFTMEISKRHRQDIA